MKNRFFSGKNYFLNDPLYLFLPAMTIAIRLAIFIMIPRTYEDAFITFRYAENIASGNGFVYNPGEKVMGTTTPLFTVLLAIMNFSGISCVFGSLLINMISEGITTLIIYSMLKSYSGQKYAFLPVLLYSLSPSNISWSIYGMETAFYGMVLAAAFYNLFKENYRWSLLFGAIACLIRIDGVGALGIIFLFILFKIRRSDLKIIILPAILLISWELFSFLYFGSFIPNSLTAKLVLYSKHSAGLMKNLDMILAKFVFKGRYLGSVTSALFLFGVIVSVRKSRKYVPFVLWFFCYYLALIFSKTLIHGWYLIPPLFVYILFIGIGIVFIFDKIEKFTKKGSLNIIIGSAIIIFSVVPLRSKIIQLDSENRYEQNVRIPIGEFLKNQTPMDATVYLEPIGIIGYYSQRYIYDDSGLISPELIEFNRRGIDVPARYRKIHYSQPDYLILRNKYLQDFYALTDIKKDFEEIKKIEYNYQGTDEGFTIFQKSPRL